MKKLLIFLMLAGLLCACGNTPEETTEEITETTEATPFIQ